MAMEYESGGVAGCDTQGWGVAENNGGYTFF